MNKKKQMKPIFRIIYVLDIIFASAFAGYGFFWLGRKVYPWFDILILMFWSIFFTSALSFTAGMWWDNGKK